MQNTENTKERKMKTNIELRGFLEALETGGQMAGKNRTQPVLDCVRMTVRNGVMRIVSFNGETGVSCPVPVLTADTDCVLCTEMKALADTLKLLDDEVVTLSADADMKALRLEHGRGAATFPLMPTEDFPEFGREEAEQEFDIPGGILRRWLQLSSKFVASDELRPVMNCMYVEDSGGRLAFCATDSHGLVTEDTPSLRPQGGSASLLMHSAVFAPALRCFRKPETVHVRICPNGAFLSADGISLYFRKTAGRYPNFRAVIPESPAFSVGVDSGELERAVRLAGSCSAGDATVTLSFRGTGMVVSAEDTVRGRKSDASVPASGMEGEMDVTVRASYLLNAVAASGSGGRLSVGVISPQKPLVFRPEGGEGPLALAMPYFSR